MNNPTTVWDECVFQARLKYLAFKRSMWLMETVLLVILLLGFPLFKTPPFVLFLFIALQSLRVVSELANHFDLARRFNVQDRFYLYPFG